MEHLTLMLCEIIPVRQPWKNGSSRTTGLPALLAGIDSPPALARRRPADGDASGACEGLAPHEGASDHHRHLDIGPAPGLDRLARRADVGMIASISLEIVRETPARLVPRLARR